jgi:hypothetical protein
LTAGASERRGAHPGDRVERWVGWYGRISMVVVSVALLAVSSRRAAVLAPVAVLLLWLAARRAGTAYRVGAGVLATLLLLDAVWLLAPSLGIDPLTATAVAALPATAAGVWLAWRRPTGGPRES